MRTSRANIRVVREGCQTKANSPTTKEEKNHSRGVSILYFYLAYHREAYTHVHITHRKFPFFFSFREHAAAATAVLPRAVRNGRWEFSFQMQIDVVPLSQSVDRPLHPSLGPIVQLFQS